MYCSILGAATVACAIAGLLPACASAHITLETREAAVGSYYKAILRVPHGCAGSPTVKIRVRIPDGMIAVKPQPKPGWTLDTVKADYAKPYAMHGAETKSGVKEIAWSGKLLDEHYDEFAFQSYLTTDLKAGQTLYFPVVQECEQGVERWIGTQGGANEPSPAPALKLLPKP